MSTTLSPTNLVAVDSTSATNWNTINNANTTLLNNTLLELNNLQDVDVSAISNGKTLKWNSSTSKWTAQTP